MIYFTSDTHYNHKNLIKSLSSWDDKITCRDFKSLEEHNNTIIENINKVVDKDDTLYHLGDVSFGGVGVLHEFVGRVNCKNIHLILGNHDESIEESKSLQSLFKSVDHYKYLKINGQRIILCHYAMRVWNKSHKGSWMLYGHSHGTLDDRKPKFPDATWIGDAYYIKNSKSMDVGIDTHSKFRPWSLSEIKDIMDKRQILLNVDHHGDR